MNGLSLSKLSDTKKGEFVSADLGCLQESMDFAGLLDTGPELAQQSATLHVKQSNFSWLLRF
jgi:hypothetical protein